jgi:hypothetical protein
MRVSEYFQLDRTQPTLDFVDVDVYDDVPLFVDPRALHRLPSDWGTECVSLLQNFFDTLLAAIRDGEDERAGRLLSSLREPNETHLGLSKERSRGRGMGADLAESVWRALRNSEARRTGLLRNLEDTILMVDGIAEVIVSDIATNIIREPLIHYTQDACRAYGIQMTPDVASGPIWDPNSCEWNNVFVDLPTIDGSRIIFIPKSIARRRMDYDAEEYYRDYILEYLREQELNQNGDLVRLLRDGRRRVNIKDLKEKYGRGKSVIVRQTFKNPDLLRRYRDAKFVKIGPPLAHDQFTDSANTPMPQWAPLMDTVLAIKTGTKDASNYENSIEKLLSALFYPALSNPRPQHQIHQGRKRIDLTYDNIAEYGFFRWLSMHYQAPQIFVECKNYGHEVGNPELDQLAGRFAPHRGQFGLLICRSFEGKELFIKRCVDTAHDQRGFIVPLDDTDLQELVEEAKQFQPGMRPTLEFSVVGHRFRRLID